MNKRHWLVEPRKEETRITLAKRNMRALLDAKITRFEMVNGKIPKGYCVCLNTKGGLGFTARSNISDDELKEVGAYYGKLVNGRQCKPKSHEHIVNACTGIYKKV